MIGSDRRPAEPRDVSAIVGLNTELAELEQLAHVGWRSTAWRPTAWCPTAWCPTCSARRPCTLDLHHITPPTVRPLQLRKP
jgi:hypothetical protein